MEHWQSMALMISIQIVIGIVVAILGFLLRRSISQIDKRLETGDLKFKDICGDIADLKEKRGFDREYFSKEYVAKDDFIRDIRALDYKIDGVAADVKKLLVMTGGRKDDAEV
jgi:hypothetical protein